MNPHVKRMGKGLCRFLSCREPKTYAEISKHMDRSLSWVSTIACRLEADSCVLALRRGKKRYLMIHPNLGCMPWDQQELWFSLSLDGKLQGPDDFTTNEG